MTIRKTPTVLGSQYVLKAQGLEWGRGTFLSLFCFTFSSTKNIVFPFSFQPATSFGIQILVHPPNTRGLLVECNSRGWFPQPRMEWRDSRGEIIPPASISHLQDTNKLFDMKMTLLLSRSSQRNVTCYLQNPVTGQEEKTSIVLSGKTCMFVLQMLAIVIKLETEEKKIICFLHLVSRILHFLDFIPHLAIFLFFSSTSSFSICLLDIRVTRGIVFAPFSLSCHQYDNGFANGISYPDLSPQL